MKRFFDTLEALDRYTRQLDLHLHELQCHRCCKNDQFVSHGYVYKPLSSTQKAIVGKRIFCTNRYGKTGCGATHRLYLAETIPSLHYNTCDLFVFLSSLFALCTIEHAYQVATGTENPRHAYRWLAKLHQKLIDYRSRLKKHSAQWVQDFTTRTRRLQLLLPTLQTLFFDSPVDPCAQYQQHWQTAFI